MVSSISFFQVGRPKIPNVQLLCRLHRRSVQTIAKNGCKPQGRKMQLPDPLPGRPSRVLQQVAPDQIPFRHIYRALRLK
jgi:hypothetical protein